MTAPQFDSINKYWTASFQTWQSLDYTLSITGKGLSLMGCSTPNALHLIPVSRLDSTSSLQSVSASVGTGTFFNLNPDLCSPNVMVSQSSVFGDNNFALTQTQYRRSDGALFTVASMTGVKQVISTSAGIFVGTTTGGSFKGASGFSASSFPSSVVLDQFRGPITCDFSANASSLLNTYITAWNSAFRSTVGANSQTFYLSKDGGASFSAFQINVDLTNVGGGYIRDIALQHSFNNLALLIRDNGVDRLVLFDPITLVVTTGPSLTSSLVIDTIKGSTPRLVPSKPGSDLYAYGESVLYSPNGGLSFFAVSLYSIDPARPAVGLDTPEFITQLVTNQRGFAVLTSTKRVFYGLIGSTRAYEVMAGLLTTDLAAIEFDGAQELRVFLASGTAPFVTSRVLPVTTQFAVARLPNTVNNPTLTCPYNSWSVSMSSEIYLDKGQQYCIKPTITLPTNSSVNRVGVHIINLVCHGQSSIVECCDQW